jgi:predicted RNase H-like HicB family nuclease
MRAETRKLKGDRKFNQEEQRINDSRMRLIEGWPYWPRLSSEKLESFDLFPSIYCFVSSLFCITFPRMLTEFLRAALSKAHYEFLDDSEGFYAEIPGLQGLYAQAGSLEACRDELAGALEDWVLFRVAKSLPIPASLRSY